MTSTFSMASMTGPMNIQGSWVYSCLFVPWIELKSATFMIPSRFTDGPWLRRVIQVPTNKAKSSDCNSVGTNCPVWTSTGPSGDVQIPCGILDCIPSLSTALHGMNRVGVCSGFKWVFNEDYVEEISRKGTRDLNTQTIKETRQGVREDKGSLANSSVWVMFLLIRNCRYPWSLAFSHSRTAPIRRFLISVNLDKAGSKVTLWGLSIYGVFDFDCNRFILKNQSKLH